MTTAEERERVEKDRWKAAVITAVRKHDAGDDEWLEDLATILHQAETAKQILRWKGYGWTGLSLLETVRLEVQEAVKYVD